MCVYEKCTPPCTTTTSKHKGGELYKQHQLQPQGVNITILISPKKRNRANERESENSEQNNCFKPAECAPNKSGFNDCILLLLLSILLYEVYSQQQRPLQK